MTRETRLNILFLVVILAVLTPGAVILFRKKLQPTIRPMHLPHAVQREHAYISPLETPPGKRRVEPPHTARWVEALVRQHVSRPGREAQMLRRPTDEEGLPLVSQRRTFQIVAAEPSQDELRLWVMLWAAAPGGQESWSVRSGDAAREFHIAKTELIAIPELVRQELGETGMTRPPHEIVWQELVIPGKSAGPVRLQRGSADFAVLVPSFTNPVATGN